MPPRKNYNGKANDKGLTASYFIKRNNLVKHAVAPDGSCWISVILATLGMYKTKVKRGGGLNIKATPDEQILANDIRQHLVPKFGAAIADSPVYVNGELEKLGAYGGDEHWQVLAPLFNLFVILWDPREYGIHMNTQRHKFICVFPDGKLKLKDALEIQNAIKANKMTDDPATVVHAAWSNTIPDHFDVYLIRKA
ncbi:MAG: hypothetical protein CMB67_04600 [Euryarchaeota archaeon]|nr:hypothetical protein [Euryarchaeota archaeon]|tara:strand:+ start:6913 stop:7497 length:585 start_codon:yes stop_codon:yes gene_type:complete